MIFHPLSLTILILDALSLFLLLVGAIKAFSILADTNPQNQDTIAPLSRCGRISFALQLGSFVLLIVGISRVFPAHINGALCGTGVLEAMGSGTTQMLFLGFLSLLFLQSWLVLDLQGRRTRPALSPINAAKGVLLSLPLVILAVFYRAKALYLIDKSEEVNCCAIYSQVITLSGAGSAQTTFILWLSVLLALSLLLVILATLLCRATRHPKINRLLLATTLIWCGVAFWSIPPILTFHHLGELDHHCPWCLFLPENSSIGFPLYLSLLGAGLAGVTLFALSLSGNRIAARQPKFPFSPILPTAILIVCLTVFLLLVSFPGVSI